MKQYGKYGERIVEQDRFRYIMTAVQTYFAAHPGTDTIIIQTRPAAFVQFLADCDIDEEEVDAIEYDLTYAVDRDAGLTD